MGAFPQKTVELQIRLQNMSLLQEGCVPAEPVPFKCKAADVLRGLSFLEHFMWVMGSIPALQPPGWTLYSQYSAMMAY